MENPDGWPRSWNWRYVDCKYKPETGIRIHEHCRLIERLSTCRDGEDCKFEYVKLNVRIVYPIPVYYVFLSCKSPVCIFLF